MLPLSLLKTAVNTPILIELKSGETYNGTLESCDAFMNINLADVIVTNRTGDRFWSLKSCYVRGVCVKYLRVQDEVRKVLFLRGVDRTMDFSVVVICMCIKKKQ